MSALSPDLLAIVACPLDHGPLLWIESESVLYNPRLHRAYAVTDGIADLLVEDAEVVDDERHRALLVAAGLSPEGEVSNTDPEGGPPWTN
ncbi:protein of unknown function DUF343 [Acidimicrobium ferrooxidans DSM 10331]|uniref:Uncharacterized protein n=1 Tax=Acidimicrobium ferrooxidans (strain DSM 10331 / JCM 15462 / NBRC 103882 / ICP) TaxID=525909 RepID=C7M133_ACIFD|nr:Trm112 family protein [Acidimicrobium ferrooxidans]ACU54681.1 protein of unknown function DUF343 [Acidimicrobium ferrooxidans DSM 10331]